MPLCLIHEGIEMMRAFVRIQFQLLFNALCVRSAFVREKRPVQTGVLSKDPSPILKCHRAYCLNCRYCPEVSVCFANYRAVRRPCTLCLKFYLTISVSMYSALSVYLQATSDIVPNVWSVNFK